MSKHACQCEMEQRLCDHVPGYCHRPAEEPTGANTDRGVMWLGIGNVCSECTDRYHAAGFGFTRADLDQEASER